MTNGSFAACPSCDSSAVCIGPIPGSNLFAGRQLDRVLPGGRLWRCNACSLVFRYPRLAKETLDKLYRHGHSESWPEQAGDRADWQLVKKILAERADLMRVLDVGCFDGRLLDSLGSRYEKLGIEIHDEAAHRAKMRNVKVIGRDFDDLRVVQNRVDVVLAMDVIEHTEDPLAFLAGIAEIVKPGGLILIGTGNSDALSWRFTGSAYWYCHIAEHISFINPRWVDYAARKLGLGKVALHRFSHGGGHVRQRFRETALNILYRLSPSLFARLRKLGAGHIDVTRFDELSKVPPYWLSATDHVLIVFRKS
jgi:SAM-dependent methyltransferase